MANALVVVDVQNYFLKDAPADLPARIVNHQQALRYDHIIFTTFRNKPDSNFVKLLKWDLCSTDDDVKLADVFQEFIGEGNIFERAAYSAFKDTKLHEYLQSKQVERLVLCGIDVDACVLATAFAAFDFGYHVKINFDLTYSSNELSKAAELIANRNIVSRD